MLVFEGNLLASFISQESQVSWKLEGKDLAPWQMTTVLIGHAIAWTLTIHAKSYIPTCLLILNFASVSEALMRAIFTGPTLQATCFLGTRSARASELPENCVCWGQFAQTFGWHTRRVSLGWQRHSARSATSFAYGHRIACCVRNQAQVLLETKGVQQQLQS